MVFTALSVGSPSDWYVLYLQNAVIRAVLAEWISTVVVGGDGDDGSVGGDGCFSRFMR